MIGHAILLDAFDLLWVISQQVDYADSGFSPQTNAIFM